MRFCLSNSSLKCASSDIQVFVAGLRDERALNTIKVHFGKGKNSVSGIYLCKIASYEKIWSDDQYDLVDTKLSEFDRGEYYALLRFVHSGNEFLYGKVLWSAFHGGFKSKYCNYTNLTTIVRMALCREM